jgi:hypothetical protein
MSRRRFLMAAGFLPPLMNAANSEYIRAVESWRREREAALKADDGWLAVAGLFWLESGANRFEATPGLTFTLAGGVVTLKSAKPVKVNGMPVRRAVLRPDAPGPADMVTIEGKTIFVIARGPRFGLRLRDPASPYRRDFRGLDWHPVKEQYRIQARWSPYKQPVKRLIATVVGIDEEMLAPGVVEFTLGGQTCKLEPVISGRRLFFIFKDRTAGKTTYPAGRFLYADPARDGVVELDFNKAINPPCAFTPHATCPLPPKQNHLPLPVEAGERTYHY